MCFRLCCNLGLELGCCLVEQITLLLQVSKQLVLGANLLQRSNVSLATKLSSCWCKRNHSPSQLVGVGARNDLENQQVGNSVDRLRVLGDGLVQSGLRLLQSAEVDFAHSLGDEAWDR